MPRSGGNGALMDSTLNPRFGPGPAGDLAALGSVPVNGVCSRRYCHFLLGLRGAGDERPGIQRLARGFLRRSSLLELLARRRHAAVDRRCRRPLDRTAAPRAGRRGIASLSALRLSRELTRALSLDLGQLARDCSNRASVRPQVELDRVRIVEPHSVGHNRLQWPSER